MNLENLGVQEMSATEVKNVEGGFLLATCIFIALLLISKSAS